MNFPFPFDRYPGLKPAMVPLGGSSCRHSIFKSYKCKKCNPLKMNESGKCDRCSFDFHPENPRIDDGSIKYYPAHYYGWTDGDKYLCLECVNKLNTLTKELVVGFITKSNLK